MHLKVLSMRAMNEKRNNATTRTECGWWWLGVDVVETDNYGSVMKLVKAANRNNGKRCKKQ
jgi:hypothetical protein